MLLRYAFPVLVVLLASEAGAADPTRLLSLDDLTKLHNVSDPQVAPDGQLVAYTVSVVDSEADKQLTHIWMANWAGDQELQVTKESVKKSGVRRRLGTADTILEILDPTRY